METKSLCVVVREAELYGLCVVSYPTETFIVHLMHLLPEAEGRSQGPASSELGQ